MRPQKIISGGQTGADQGGLEAAKMLGIPTGGTAPPRFMTDEGSYPALHEIYGLVEGRPDPSTYRTRTIQNVIDCTGTVWFGDISSPGGRLTIGECKRRCRPVLFNPSPGMLRNWVGVYAINILNVAGNRERTNPGIFRHTTEVIVAAFKVSMDEQVSRIA